jgi:hypothetical protein
MDSIDPTGTVPAMRAGPVMGVLLQGRAGEPQDRSRQWGSLAVVVARQPGEGGCLAGR